MQNRQKNQIIGIAVIVVLLGLGYYFVNNRPSSNAPADANSTTSSATTTESDVSGGTVGITSTGDYTIKEVSSENKASKAPDYNAPIAFSASVNLSAEQKSSLEAQAASLRAKLSKNPSDYVAWLALGRTYKMAGDYAQAAKIWTYLTLLWPKDATAFGNLGDLYMNFIKDYPKADASYLAAIRNDPRQTNAYRNLYLLYSSLYTPRASAAADILKQGIKNNPEALDLYVLLARYYTDAGRTAEARLAYDSAVVIARGQTNAGSAQILADIEAERAALK